MNQMQRYRAPALEKGLDILELLSRQEFGLSQVEIARQLDRSVGEIFRMLAVLLERGYIALDPDSDRYVLTTFLFEVANRIPLVRRLTGLAGPVMRRLAHAINQSVHLAVLSGDCILVIGQVDSPGYNITAVRVGATIDLWRTSSGRVIVAHLGQEARENVFRQCPPPGDAADIEAELAAIRQAGHEVRDSLVIRGIVNISAPIIDHSGHAIAALTVPHMDRIDSRISFDECRDRLCAAAHSLTVSLGGGNSEMAPARNGVQPEATASSRQP